MKTIFYSWQSDLPNALNRGFISDVLKKVVKSINESNEYEIDFNLDRDTSGELGSPDIVDTIFKKIAASDVFVCDVSIINHGESGRKTPNPNVLVELGYAASTLGWENIVCLFNLEYGAIDDLPFDIQHRRIIPYNLSRNSNKTDVRNALVMTLNKSLENIGTEALIRKRQVIKAFEKEPNETVRIALNKPDYWEFKLSEALYYNRLKVLEEELDIIDAGIHYRAKKSLRDRELFDWLRMKLEDMGSLLSSLTSAFEKKWPDALGEPGVAGDELLILRAIDMLFSRIHDCIEWERDFRSVHPPDEIEDAYKKVSLIFRDIINEFHKVPILLKGVYTTEQPEGGHDIGIALRFPEEEVKAFHDIIADMRKRLLQE